MSKKKKVILSREDLAERTGRTVRAVDRWKKEGMPFERTGDPFWNSVGIAFDDAKKWLALHRPEIHIRATRA